MYTGAGLPRSAQQVGSPWELACCAPALSARVCCRSGVALMMIEEYKKEIEKKHTQKQGWDG